MNAPAIATDVLIDEILERFHEGHRRDLPPLVAQARALAPALADALQALGAALEDHMFKEEARLFPMMQQGGNTLLPRLIDDLAREHREHEARLAALQALVQSKPLPVDLADGLRRFVAELQAHVAAEDGVLFPRFLPAD